MIRKFSLEDSEAIYSLGNTITENFSKTNDLEEIKNDPFTKILVYEEQKKIIGFIMYVELAETADILDIIVDDDYRNRKIASCLMDYMISNLKESVKLLTLEVRASNVPAIRLYEKFGFSIIHTRKQYYGNEDAYLMGRRY